MFPQCFPGNIVSSVSFCFQDANYAYATRQGILTKIRACEHLQKVCEHEQASTHLMGPFDTRNVWIPRYVHGVGGGAGGWFQLTDA